MPAFTNPSFQERQEAAAQAKNAALVMYLSKPPADKALIEGRAARQAARLAIAVEKRAAGRRAKEEAAEAKREQERQAAAAAVEARTSELAAAAQARSEAAAKKASEKKLWTEDDRKAARDARYAARKMRKSGR